MTLLLNILIAGIGVGVLYGLMALPLSLVASSTGVLDVAIGGYVMLAALTAASLGGVQGIVLGLAFALIASLVVAGLFQLAARKGRADAITITVLGVGVLFATQSLARGFFGGDPLRILAVQDQILWLGLTIPWIIVIAVVLVAAIVTVILVVIYRTRLGREMRAIADDSVAAQLMGIPVRGIQVSVFAAAGLLAGIAGIVLVVARGMAFSDGLPLSLLGFLALVVLGVAGPVRAVLGGVFVGVLESLSIGYLPAQIASAAPLIIVVALLATGRINVGVLGKA